MAKKITLFLALILAALTLTACDAEHTVTVRYVDTETGAEISEPYTITLGRREKYDVAAQTAREVAGYRVLVVEGAASGRLREDVTVTVRYEFVGCTATVNYVDAGTGDALRDPYVLRLGEGAQFDITAQVSVDFEGYVRNPYNDAVSGELWVDKTFTVEYCRDWTALSYEEYFSMPRTFVPLNYDPVVYYHSGSGGLKSLYPNIPTQVRTTSGVVMRGWRDEPGKTTYRHLTLTTPDGTAVELLGGYMITYDKVYDEHMTIKQARGPLGYPPEMMMNNEVIYTISFDSIVRIHIPSRTTDVLYTVKNDYPAFAKIFVLYPLSTTEIFFAVWTEEVFHDRMQPYYEREYMYADITAEHPRFLLYVFDSIESKLYSLGDGYTSSIMNGAADLDIFVNSEIPVHPGWFFANDVMIDRIRKAYAEVK